MYLKMERNLDLAYKINLKQQDRGKLMECKQKSNLVHCNCTYEPCPRKGICCDCIQYHLKSRQMPACFFSEDAEKTYDRSFNHFIRLNS